MTFPNGISLDLDFTPGSMPGGLTYTRASVATDSFYTDASGSGYNSFATDVPRWINGGLYIEGLRTNFLLNSAAPVTQTTGSLAVSGGNIYCLWVIGTGSATAAAGTAVGAGFGTATAGTPLFFSITTAGTVVVTVAGSLNRFQLELAVSGAGVTNPSSFIPTAGAILARQPDLCSMATGAWFNNAAFTLYAEGVIPVLPPASASLVMVNNGANLTGLNVTIAGVIRLSDTVGPVNSNLVGTPTFGSVFRAMGAFRNGRQAGCINGGTLTNVAAATLTGSLTTLNIGHNNGTFQLFGTMRRVRVWPTDLLGPDLQVGSSASPLVAAAALGRQPAKGSTTVSPLLVSPAARGVAATRATAALAPLLVSPSARGFESAAGVSSWRVSASLGARGMAGAAAAMGFPQWFVGVTPLAVRGRANLGRGAGRLSIAVPILSLSTRGTAISRSLAYGISLFNVAARGGTQPGGQLAWLTASARGRALAGGTAVSTLFLAQVSATGMALPGGIAGGFATPPLLGRGGAIASGRSRLIGFPKARGFARPKGGIVVISHVSYTARGRAFVRARIGAHLELFGPQPGAPLTVWQRLASITPSHSVQEKPRVVRNQFGDGYGQSLPDGLSPVVRTMTLTWENLARTEVDALIQFFRDNAGNTISFAAPREASPRNWMVIDWHRTSPQPDSDNLTVNFEDRPYVERSVLLGIGGRNIIGTGKLG